MDNAIDNQQTYDNYKEQFLRLNKALACGFNLEAMIIEYVIAYLDRITVYGRIKNDDVSVMNLMDHFTLAQITDFLRVAGETQAVNVTAALLDYKNTHFGDFDPMEEFTLE